jgi:hypothetical protein
MLLLVGAEAFFQQAAPIEEAMNPAGDLPGDELDVLGSGLDGHEMGSVLWALSAEDAIRDEDVEVHIEIQCASESLNRGDRATSRCFQAALPGGSSEVSEDGSQHNGEDALRGRAFEVHRPRPA